MKFVGISDTHGRHRQVTNLPEGDVLLHGGDVCNRGNAEQVEDFLDWFAELDYQWKIFISGNHDFDLERGECLILNKLSDGSTYPKNLIHLVDQAIEIGPFKIWGAATNPKAGLSIESAEDWALVPEDTHILITHYPPRGILDQNWANKHCGLEALTECVNSVAPDVHLFGDIHASYGEKTIGKTRFFNASLYRAKTDSIVNSAFEFEL